MWTDKAAEELECPDIPEDKLKAIYYALISQFSDGQEIEMARFSLAMNDAGFNCKSLGFPKMKLMLPRMARFITCRTDPNSSVDDLLLTLHCVPEWAVEQQASQNTGVLPGNPGFGFGPDELNALTASSFGPLTEEELQKLPDDFSKVDLTMATQNKLRGYLTGIYIQGVDSLLEAEQISQIAKDYAKAKTANLFRINEHKAGSYDFPTHFRAHQGDLLFLTLAPSNNGTSRCSWYTCFCGVLFNTASQIQKSQKTAELPSELTDDSITPLARTAMHCYLHGLPFDPKLPFLESDPKEIQTLKDSYAAAQKEHHIFPTDDNGYLFLAALYTPNQQRLQAEMALQYTGQWKINRIKPAKPSEALEHFANMGNWSEILQRLADKALGEHWAFGNANDKRILMSYLRYTFYRLECENKVLESKNKQYAAINTGLVDESYDDIFAVFVPQTLSKGVAWKFCTFCVESESPWGKELVRTFNPLPKRAEYFNLSNASDLLYDDSCHLSPDYDHIIVKRIYRWPLDVLCKNLTDPEMESVLSQLQETVKTSNYKGIKDGYKKLQELLDSNSMYKRRLHECLDAAIDRARKRVRWNYQTALPSYFPTGNNMSLMLPLDLTGTGRVDFALVVERQKNKTYIGQTILTLAQAYVDARLVCRPDKDWLNNESIELILDTEEDENFVE